MILSRPGKMLGLCLTLSAHAEKEVRALSSERAAIVCVKRFGWK